MRTALAIPLLLLVGCYTTHDGSGDRADASTPGLDGGPIGPPIDTGPPATACRGMLFLLDQWDLDEASGETAHGMDLDGQVSTGEGFSCVDLTPDFTSLYTGEPGVDNAFATLVPTIESLLERPIQDVLRDEVASGAFLYALEVLEADSESDDPSIRIVFHRATAIDGLRFLPDGSLAPEQRLALEPVSEGRGSIAGGWVTAELDSFELAVGGSGVIVPILPTVLQRARVRFQIDCDAGTITRPELAGTTTIDDAAASAERFMPGFGETVRSVLGGIADLDPDPTDSTICRSLSFAYTFRGTIARR